jgi:hypothetical protein
MRRLAPILAITTALLAGCSEGEGGTTITEPTLPGPTDSLVVYERTGGIAGIREYLAVRPDGVARVETGYPGPGSKVMRVELTPSELDGLRKARDAVDFASLDAEYGPDQQIADGFATSIRADGREVTVLTEGDPPPELQRLMSVSAGLVEVHARR